MTKTEARQRIRNLKSSILNSTEIFAEALANNHYKTANKQSIIISGNLKGLVPKAQPHSHQLGKALRRRLLSEACVSEFELL